MFFPYDAEVWQPVQVLLWYIRTGLSNWCPAGSLQGVTMRPLSSHLTASPPTILAAVAAQSSGLFLLPSPSSFCLHLRGDVQDGKVQHRCTVSLVQDAHKEWYSGSGGGHAMQWGRGEHPCNVVCDGEEHPCSAVYS